MGNEQTIDEQREIMEKFPDSKEPIFNFNTEEKNEDKETFKRKRDHHKILSINIDKDTRTKWLNKKIEEEQKEHYHKSLFSKNPEINIPKDKNKKKKSSIQTKRK